MKTIESNGVNHAVLVPAGDYFLGDPCYAVPDIHWSPLLESCDCFNQVPVGEVNGFKVLSFVTAYGDGTYKDQLGNEYPVDAGMIGLVPVGLIDQAEMKAMYPSYIPGKMVTFDHEVRASCQGGRLTFGQYVINTDLPDDDLGLLTAEEEEQ